MIPKGEMCCQMVEQCLEFAKDRELKIQRRFEKTHELFATKIESTFEAVIASFDESTYVTKSQKLLNEPSTNKEINEFARNIAGLGSERMRDMDRLYSQFSVMRSALEKVFNVCFVELDRVLNEFEQKIVECDLYNENACD